MKITVDGCFKAAAKKPDANTRAMGASVAIALFAVVSAALLYKFMRGSAFVFQSLLIYLPSLAFCVLMFVCPGKERWIAAIPAAAWCACFVIGILIQQGIPSAVKVIAVLASLVVFCLTACSVADIPYCRSAMLVLSVAMCVLCTVYGVYDLVSAVVDGASDWSNDIASEAPSFISGLLAKGDDMTLPNIRLTSFVFMIPSAMLFYCTAQTSYLFADTRRS